MSKEDIIREIKKKKELSGITDSLVSSLLEDYLEKNRLSLEKLAPSYRKILIKDIRASLREHVGRFKSSLKDRKKLLERGEISKLLRTHLSTKERIDFYPRLKEMIKNLSPSSILDLGCGINPIALAEKDVKYYASDVNLDDLELVRLFFKKKKIQGETFVCDMRDINRCSFPSADICLILKVFDILGKDDYEIAKNVMNKIECKQAIVSFSTKTLSGKSLSQKRRMWFEKLLDRSGHRFEIVNSDNEIFYVIEMKN